MLQAHDATFDDKVTEVNVRVCWGPGVDRILDGRGGCSFALSFHYERIISGKVCLVHSNYVHSPSGTGFRHPAELGTPESQQDLGSHWNDSIFCPSGMCFRRPAEFGTPVRRAARRGRLWGCAPFAAPLASPPKHPQRGIFNYLCVARATRHLLRELPSLAALGQVISLRAA